MVLRVAAFVVVWSLYFAVTEHASAIHNDMAEAYAWGREFQLGYNQHPPFWAWICGLWFLIFPRANWAFAVLSMLNAGAGLLGAWALIGRFVDGDRRVAATELLALTPFYSFLAYKYNANSIFLSLWPWTLYAFVSALRSRGLAASLGFGAMMGLALNSKYYALTLAATCLIAALASVERGRYFRSASPYVSVAVALALWAPHLLLAGDDGRAADPLSRARLRTDVRRDSLFRGERRDRRRPATVRGRSSGRGDEAAAGRLSGRLREPPPAADSRPGARRPERGRRARPAHQDLVEHADRRVSR